MLDVCCYTGGFGISALVRGGARDVTCIDLDEKSIAQARENANLNQVRPQFVHADAFGYLRQMGVNARDFGVVVLDPPKLIPGRLDIAAGKRKLLRPEHPGDADRRAGRRPAALDLLLLGASSRRGVRDPAEGRREAVAGRSARVLAVTGARSDHPVGLNALEGAYLKAVWLQMGDRQAPRRTTRRAAR